MAVDRREFHARPGWSSTYESNVNNVPGTPRFLGHCPSWRSRRGLRRLRGFLSAVACRVVPITHSVSFDVAWAFGADPFFRWESPIASFDPSSPLGFPDSPLRDADSFRSVPTGPPWKVSDGGWLVGWLVGIGWGFHGFAPTRVGWFLRTRVGLGSSMGVRFRSHSGQGGGPVGPGWGENRWVQVGRGARSPSQCFGSPRGGPTSIGGLGLTLPPKRKKG
eukprot:scaffold287_cov337-Pavlova_lutheri.AAC.17